MVDINRIRIEPSIINTSCAWASELAQLEDLYKSPYTGAVTTRTATLGGFAEDSSHAVVFGSTSASTLNSYGYSPHPLSSYIKWTHAILSRDTQSKPLIISITSNSASELVQMVEDVQKLRQRLGDSVKDIPSRVAIELNTSCPNIRGKPPPAYSFTTLLPILGVLTRAYRTDRTLTIGLKLAPYVASFQFEEVVKSIATSSYDLEDGNRANPFAFLTCTNTVGNSLLFVHQTTSSLAIGNGADMYALGPVLGGLAGEPIHALSLGNVFSFARLLENHEDKAVRMIKLIGVGGVVDKQGVERMRKVGAAVVGCATLLGREGVKGFEKLA
ncbi:FMN-linked oxidoreductase [Thelephora ganbajun]|uniref:FMN-linked oxidoreductase n=1 Tax=Thelephora ganbajun TaxID=370292 RepID=A0ACB6ZRI9_THEGA|nr:FMN-linked oxidoreductase [Thelephora ganbajun]